MKKTLSISMLAASLTMMTCCTSEDPFEEFYNGNNSWTNGEESFGGGSSTTGELATFNVAIDKTTAEPTATASEYFPDEEDVFENNDFSLEVAIDMSNPVAKTENGVEVTVNNGHVTANHSSVKKVCYVLNGTTSNGSFTVLGEKKYAVKLNGVSITNPDSAALNLLSGKRAYVVLSDGTTNTLADGTGGSQKGALYCKGKLLFNGGGQLSVTGNSNNGIHSADYIVTNKGNNIYVKSTANHGIKAGDDLYINGGILNVEVSAPGAKGINGDIDVTVNGGRITVVSTSNGKWDDEDLETKASAGIACDSVLTINGGEIFLKSTGSGGKGLKADWEGYINGGKIRIITEGGLYYSNGTTESHNYTGDTERLDDEYTSSPKGIKIGTKNEHGVLTITDGDIMVRTSGNNAEGIESKGTLDITGGQVLVYAHDDAINSSSDLTISGGTVVAVGTNNDAIDANGNLYIKGGSIVAMGASGAEAGLDADESHAMYISGGSVFAIGGRIDVKLGSTSQGIIQTTGSVSANSTASVRSGSTTLATFDMPPYSSTNGTILVTAKGMTSGSSYTLTIGGKSQTVTASNSISSGMGGGPGGGPGGFQP